MKDLDEALFNKTLRLHLFTISQWPGYSWEEILLTDDYKPSMRVLIVRPELNQETTTRY